MWYKIEMYDSMNKCWIYMGGTETINTEKYTILKETKTFVRAYRRDNGIIKRYRFRKMKEV